MPCRGERTGQPHTTLRVNLTDAMLSEEAATKENVLKDSILTKHQNGKAKRIYGARGRDGVTLGE